MSPPPTGGSRCTSSGSSTSTSCPTTATTDPPTGGFDRQLVCVSFLLFLGFLMCFFSLYSFVRTAIPFTQEPQRDKPANAQPYYLYGSKVGAARRREHMRAKGKTAPMKYNVAPDVARRETTNNPII